MTYFQGSPIVISSAYNCSVDFLWETSRACLHHATDARKEVRCYAFDSKGKKRDLEYLIKQVGNQRCIFGFLFFDVCRFRLAVIMLKIHRRPDQGPTGFTSTCVVIFKQLLFTIAQLMRRLVSLKTGNRTCSEHLLKELT